MIQFKSPYLNPVAILHWVTIAGGALTALASYFATVPGLSPAVLQIVGGAVVAVGIASYGLHSAIAYNAELGNQAAITAVSLTQPTVTAVNQPTDTSPPLPAPPPTPAPALPVVVPAPVPPTP